LQALGFFLLTLLPANFSYVWFALIIFLLGLGQGMFSSPNTSSLMGSVPADQRGTASGMRATFQNSGSVVSIGAFFSVITAGLAVALPVALGGGLIQAGVPADVANKIGHLPPTSALFAAFLGYNPIATLVPAPVLQALSPAKQANLLGHEFFPNLISGPFMASLHNVFYLSVAMCLVAALASLLRGKHQTPGTAVVSDDESGVQQEEVSASSAGD
jgi:MFS family permease